jgi:hypothetical protein
VATNDVTGRSMVVSSAVTVASSVSHSCDFRVQNSSEIFPRLAAW